MRAIIHNVTESDNPSELNLKIYWPDVADMPVLRLNQFVGQLPTSEEALLAVGYVAPPIVIGDPTETRAFMSAMGSVGVKAYGRYSFTRTSMKELIGILVGLDQQWDEAVGGGDR